MEVDIRFYWWNIPEVNVDEEGVEPPVHHEQSHGDLVAADDLNLLPWVPRVQADVQEAAEGEGRVETWGISGLQLAATGNFLSTSYNEEKEDILIENTPKLSFGG